MGNNISQPVQPLVGVEMHSSKEFPKRKFIAESLCNLQELQRDCLALKVGAKTLTSAIEDIFLENDDSRDKVYKMERRLRALIRFNQAIVHKLTRNLILHANVVDQGVQNNEILMAIVKNLVSTINSYMTMLVRNIKKMKRLISEIDPVSGWTSLSPQNTVYDVISNNQDVDAMLDQLVEMERQREDLEEDIITVLVCWRSYRYFLVATKWNKKNGGEIDVNVKVAAENVARCLAYLKRSKR